MKLTWDYFNHQIDWDIPTRDGEVCHLADKPTIVKEVLEYASNGVWIEDIFGRVSRVSLPALVAVPN